MHKTLVTCSIALGLVAGVSCRNTSDRSEGAGTAPAPRGSVNGHVRARGTVPQNDTIRMSADPMCAKAGAGSHVVDDAVISAPDGSMANAFVELVGDFPDTPVPAEPVSVDQRGCIYRPRVVGVRAGQPLIVRNSDDGLHNVHGVSTGRDGFNVSQPMSGMANTFHPRDPGILSLKCDVHTWMVAFVGVVNHPYFAVTDKDGSFELHDVPAGTYDVRAWHERLGIVTLPVRVESGRAADAEIVYSAPPAKE